MNLGELRELPPEAIAALAAAVAFLTVMAIGIQWATWRLRSELSAAGAGDLVDQTTGLLPRSALPVRLGAELAWGGVSGTPISVAVLRIRGARFLDAVGVLREAMREEEQAFVLGEQRVAIELWGADPAAAVLATRRIGRELASAGHTVVDAGLACAPRDAVDPVSLVDLALEDLRPVDDPIAPGTNAGGHPIPSGRSGRPAVRLRSTVGALGWFAAFLLLVLACWRLLPAAIEPALGAAREGRDARAWFAVAVALVALPLAAACAHVAGWNAAAAGLPRSTPFSRAGVRAGACVAAALLLPLAWAALRPAPVAGLPAAFGLQLAMLVLVVLVLMHARLAVHLHALVLVLIASGGGGLVWAGSELGAPDAMAAVGRLVFAAAVGALFAKYIERASWLVGLAALAAAVDVWSVFAESGLTNSLLESGTSEHLLVRLVLFQGPVLDGAPELALGTTDLVFVAVFLAWSHDWRIDMRLVAPALVVALWVTAAAVHWSDRTLPALPALALAMFAVLAWRWSRLRGRAAAWRLQHPPE